MSVSELTQMNSKQLYLQRLNKTIFCSIKKVGTVWQVIICLFTTMCSELTCGGNQYALVNVQPLPPAFMPSFLLTQLHIAG